MLGSQHHVGHAIDRIGAGGEDGDFGVGQGGVPDDREVQQGSGRFADPVSLHGFHPFGPAGQLVQIRQQLFGVVGDFEEPLTQQPFFDQRPRSPGFALAIDLFVGQNGLVDRIPIHRGFLLVSQPGGEKLQENPLSPAVIIRAAGGHFPLPVVGEAQALELALHLGDILLRPNGGMHPPIDRRVLSGQAKGIPAHRVQHLVALHPSHPGDRIGDRIVADMAHVQIP